MRNWRDLFTQKKLLVADGAWGTELAKLRPAAGDVPELLNLERPDDVRAVAVSYVEAGADIILSNTFGGSPLKLAKAGLGDRVEELNSRGVALSREAAGDHALVFASVGPTGEFMAPLGTVSEEEMVEQFARQARALAAGGADGVVIETMTDLGEAKAALRAVKESTGLPAVVSMTYNSGPGGYATMMGVRPDQAARELQSAGADIVGANCGAGIAEMVEVARLTHSGTSLPVWCKPNAGLPELVNGATVYRQTPEEMVKYLPLLIEAGASIVGGCCGTTPEHIRLLVAECANIVAAAQAHLAFNARRRNEEGR